MRAAFIALVCAVSLPAGAILIRADRDDAEYLELATKYAASVAIGPVDAEGVLIAPSWVLTSARGPWGRHGEFKRSFESAS